MKASLHDDLRMISKQSDSQSFQRTHFNFSQLSTVLDIRYYIKKISYEYTVYILTYQNFYIDFGSIIYCVRVKLFSYILQ